MDWHLFVPVLVTILIFILGQVITGLVFGTRVSSMVVTELKGVKKEVEGLRSDLKDTVREVVGVSQRVVRLETLAERQLRQVQLAKENGS